MVQGIIGGILISGILISIVVFICYFGYTLIIWSIQKKTTIATMAGEIKSQTPVFRNSSSAENVKIFLGVLFSLFLLWMMFGGLFENQNDYSSKNTVTIDCRQPGWANDPICTREYESQTQQQDFNEDNYYQNIVR